MKRLAKLSWIEAKLFLRDPVAVIFSFAFPFIVLFVLAGVFGNELDSTDAEEMEAWRGVGPTDYYVPAYLGMVMAAIGLISLPLHLTSYRERGVLRRFRAAGVPGALLVASQVAVAVGTAAVGGLVIAVSSFVLYDASAPQELVLVLVAWLLSATTFAAVGVLLGTVLPTTRAAQSIGLILFFVMMFISGGGPPRDVLPTSMRAAGSTLPLTHIIYTLQAPWLGFGWDATASLITAGFLLASVAALAARFRSE